MSKSLLQELLGALDLAVFAGGESSGFRLEGTAPPWLRNLWPQVEVDSGFITAADFSPFLDNFLVDAAAYWEARTGPGLRSGAWLEHDNSGKEIALEATALVLDAQPVLLIERLGDRYTERTSILQKARETVLAYERLNQEIQKKQILLHCVVHDMAGQLSNLVTSLRLIELENPSPRVRKLTSLATLAAQKQQDLINRVFDTFVHELDSLHGYGSKQEEGLDLPPVLRQVFDSFFAPASEKGVKLALEVLPQGGAQSMLVVAEPENLKRVLGNLLENALRYSPAGKTVIVRLSSQGDTVLVEIEDECSTIPHPVRGHGISAFSQPTWEISADALALHFCRIAVENWGGQIGNFPRDPVGHTFWFRLARAEKPPLSSSEAATK